MYFLVIRGSSRKGAWVHPSCKKLAANIPNTPNTSETQIDFFVSFCNKVLNPGIFSGYPFSCLMYSHKNSIEIEVFKIATCSVFCLIHWLDNALLFRVSPTIFHHLKVSCAPKFSQMFKHSNKVNLHFPLVVVTSANIFRYENHLQMPKQQTKLCFYYLIYI